MASRRVVTYLDRGGKVFISDNRAGCVKGTWGIGKEGLLPCTRKRFLHDIAHSIFYKRFLKLAVKNRSKAMVKEA